MQSFMGYHIWGVRWKREGEGKGMGMGMGEISLLACGLWLVRGVMGVSEVGWSICSF